ncbi:hypothetical protein EON81_19840 [bacterium]|nr:MAG: hypothetical protein EON81_19840 [bacterium]
MRRALLLSFALLAVAGCGTNYEDAGRPDYMPAPGFTAPDEAPGPEGLKSGAQQDTKGQPVAGHGEHATGAADGEEEAKHEDATKPAEAPGHEGHGH